MLATRIIPTILMKNGHLVKGEQFKADRIVGNALQAARIHAMRGVDEIMILDVSATRDGRGPDWRLVEQLTKRTQVPVTVGGGIQYLDDVKLLFDSGADKVSIGVGVGNDRHIVSEIAKKYGCQSVVVSLDIDDRPRDGYRDTAYIACAVTLAKWYEGEGAGEILLQSMQRDGIMDGYDLDLIGDVSSSVGIPVIASGGCSGYPDMLSAINAGASAVAAGALFQFTDATPRGAAEYLHSQGVEVRL